MLKTIGTHMTIADYCEEYLAKKIYVNKDYQRSDERWSGPARSFLIESILLGYPLPKFYLYPLTDTKRRRSLKEIVDGQQRTHAIVDFYSNELALSNNFEIEPLRGKTYKGIGPDLQRDFLNYPLSIDLFTDILEEEIYEVFRRMNSNAQTLTPEEIRHAQFQGKFKWFIYLRGREFEKPLSELKTFGPRQFIKMLDLRWLTEILDSLENGIRTTKGADLKAIYRDNDKSYPDQAKHKKLLEEIRRKLPGLKSLQGSPVTRPHMLASISLALLHVHHRIPAFSSVYKVISRRDVKLDRHVEALRELARAIAQKEDRGPLASVVLASTEGTNVKKARQVRFKYFCELFAGK
jgi:Protein of unknown function DUF262